MSVQSGKNSRKINILSFILFIGVMMIHTYNLEVYGIENSEGFIIVFETFMKKFLNGICVPYFFVISGFLFFRNFDLGLLLYKYKSRCRSILLPYLVWNTLYYLFFAGITNVSFLLRAAGNIDTVEFSINSYINYIWNGYYTFWFLRILIWMIICTPILWLLLKRKKWYCPEILLILMIILDMHGKSVLSLNVYYSLGAYLGMNYSKLLDENRDGTVLPVVFLIALIIAGWWFSGNILYNVLLIVTSWFAMDWFDFSRDVRWWMKCTFFYYCGHDMILESIEKLISILFDKSQMMALVDYLLAPMLTLIILISCAWFMRKYAKTMWSVLNGGRI